MNTIFKFAAFPVAEVRKSRREIRDLADKVVELQNKLKKS